jgi:uncharacterized protein
VYLDANFLAFLALPKHDDRKKRVREKLAQILVSRCDVYISCLVLDETWMAVKKNYNALNNTAKSGFDEPVYSLVSKLSHDVLGKWTIIQFKDPQQGSREALSNIKDFKLKPRDAFHLAMMTDAGISEIVTNDLNFNNVPHIKVNSF